MPDPADYYREIYARGLGGESPSIPVAIAELERRAAEEMEESAAAYVFAGAGAEDTIDANRAAFARRRLVPRMLRDVAQRDLSTTRARDRDAGAAACWRRSESRRSSTRTASSPPPAPPGRSGSR